MTAGEAADSRRLRMADWVSWSDTISVVVDEEAYLDIYLFLASLAWHERE